MYVVYINLLYFLSIFLFTYNKNLLSQKKFYLCGVIGYGADCPPGGHAFEPSHRHNYTLCIAG